MKSSASTSASAAPVAAVELTGDASGSPAGAWTRFWFAPIAPTGLAWIRCLAAAVFLIWLVPVTAERHALFGLDGYFDVTAHKEASKLPELAKPPINWSLLYAFGSSAALFDVFWWGSIAVLVLFALGVATRITAVLTWLIVVSFLASPASHPDTDYVLVLPAFYLMLAYLALGQWSWSLSPVERLIGPRGTSVFALLRGHEYDRPPSHAANLTLRLMQVHFAILVVTSGLHKLQVDHWWAGVAYWFPMHPPLKTDLARLQADRLHGDALLLVLTLTGYFALAWQLTFPLFAWRKAAPAVPVRSQATISPPLMLLGFVWRHRTRVLLLGGGLVGALGAIFLWDEPTFGPVYALGCLTFLTPSEWQWLTDRIARPFVRREESAGQSPLAERKLRIKASTAVRQ
jgi:hypothetical protein